MAKKCTALCDLEACRLVRAGIACVLVSLVSAWVSQVALGDERTDPTKETETQPEGVKPNTAHTIDSGMAQPAPDQEPRAEATRDSLQTQANPTASKAPQTAKPEGPDLKSPDPTAHWYSFGLGLGLSAMGSVTWKFVTKWTGSFDTIDEGWFGKGTYAGGADKLGHMYTDFVLGRGLYKLYRAHHYTKRDAIFYSFVAGATTRSIMEVADGFTTYEFSVGDLIFNMAGATSNALLLMDDALADTFYMSWSYLPSKEIYQGYQDPLDFSTDYSGMVFGLNAEIEGVRRLMGATRPTFWDDTYVGVNYFTRYFRQPEYNRRERYIGLSIGLSLDKELPDDHWGRPVLKFVKLPYTFAGVAYSLDRSNLEAKWGLNYLL